MQTAHVHFCILIHQAVVDHTAQCARALLYLTAAGRYGMRGVYWIAFAMHYLKEGAGSHGAGWHALRTGITSWRERVAMVAGGMHCARALPQRIGQLWRQVAYSAHAHCYTSRQQAAKEPGGIFCTCTLIYLKAAGS